MSDGLAEDSAPNTATTNNAVAAAATPRHHHRHHQHRQHGVAAHTTTTATTIEHTSAAPDIDSDELVSACRRLGITGPLEPLMRELKSNSQRSKQQLAYQLAVGAGSPQSPTTVQQQQHQHHQQHHQSRQMSAAQRSGRAPERKTSSSATRHSSSTRSKQQQSSAAPTGPTSPQNQQTHQYHFLDEASKGTAPTYGQESWGRDSGARDLSPAEQRGLMRCDDGSGGGGLMHLAPVAGSTAGDTQATTSSMIHLANQVSSLSIIPNSTLQK